MHKLIEFYLKPRVHYVLWTLGWALLGAEQVFLHSGMVMVMVVICGLVAAMSAIAAYYAWRKPHSL